MVNEIILIFQRFTGIFRGEHIRIIATEVSGSKIKENKGKGLTRRFVTDRAYKVVNVVRDWRRDR